MKWRRREHCRGRTPARQKGVRAGTRRRRRSTLRRLGELLDGDAEDGDAVLEAVSVHGIESAVHVLHQLAELLRHAALQVRGLHRDHLVPELLEALHGRRGEATGEVE